MKIPEDALAALTLEGLDEEWGTLDAVRAWLRERATEWIPDDDDRERVLTVVSELLENTIKYCDWTRAIAPRLDAALGPHGMVILETLNPVDPSSRAFERLDEHVKSLKTYASAESAFHAKVAARLHGDQPRRPNTGFGLLRVLHEASASLQIESTADHLLTVRALLTLRRRPDCASDEGSRTRRTSQVQLRVLPRVTATLARCGTK